jgi:hypothetical protein
MTANPLGSRIRGAFERWAHRSAALSCGCAACSGEDVYRTEADDQPEITRYTQDYIR